MKKFCAVALLFVISNMVTSVAFAKSDACCGEPLTCFCYKAENGDWLRGHYLANVPPKADTKGLQFKERDMKQQPARKAAPEAKPVQKQR